MGAELHPLLHIEITQLQTRQKELLENLWRYYQFDSAIRENLDVDESRRFETPAQVFSQDLVGAKGSSAHLIRYDGAVAGFLILHAAEIESRPITEFADLYVLPRYRGCGVATAVIDQVILKSTQPWLIAVFRNDSQAEAFWRRAFERLPFSSCREIEPPELPEFYEFVVNENGA